MKVGGQEQIQNICQDSWLSQEERNRMVAEGQVKNFFFHQHDQRRSNQKHKV